MRIRRRLVDDDDDADRLGEASDGGHRLRRGRRLRSVDHHDIGVIAGDQLGDTVRLSGGGHRAPTV